MITPTTTSLPVTKLAPEDPRYLESRSTAYRVLTRVEQLVASLLLVGLFAVIVVQVVARYIFNAPIGGSEEIARFAFIWFTFTAVSFVAARRKHITVKLYGGGATGKGAAAVEVLAYIIMAAASIGMIIGGIHVLNSMWHIASPGTETPYPLVYSVVPIGFALVAMHAAVNAVLAVRSPQQFAGQDDVETAGL